MRIVEICCGSYYDAKQAALGGAKRIELNSALPLGGLTPTLPVLEMVKQDFALEVIAMVRPRGAGFCYLEEDFQVMLAECELLVQHGADGIAFGCLTKDASPDLYKSQKMLEIIKSHGKKAVFHRAFDCCSDPDAAMEALIAIGVDRVLSSGLQPKAADGAALLKHLQNTYGDRMELLAGSGINSANAKWLMAETGISQVHSSCKSWTKDPTTAVGNVSYGYTAPPYEACYDTVSAALVRELIESVE